MRERHTPAVRPACAWRDVRVTRGRHRTVQPARCGDAAAFVQALLRRYAGRQAPWNPLSLTFRRNRAPVTVHPVHHTTRIRIAPRLALTLVRLEAGADGPAQAATRERVQDPGEAWLRRATRAEWRLVHRVATERTVRELVYRISTNARVQRFAEEVLVRRLVTRGERREAAMQPGSGSKAPTPGPPPAMQPVARVVRRPVLVTERREAPAAGPSGPSAAPPVQRSGFPGGARPPEPAPLDVERLTDQVVRAIDRRIIAHRERLGRR